MNSSSLFKEIQEINYQFRRGVIVTCGRFMGIILLVTVSFRHLVTPLRPIMMVIILLLSVVLFSFPLLLRSKISTETCSAILLLTITMISFGAGMTNGGLRAPAISLLVIVPLIGALTNGEKGSWFGTILSLLTIVSLYILQKYNLVMPLDTSALDKIPMYTPVVLLGVMVAALMVGILYENFKKQSERNILEISLKAQQASKMAALGEMSSGLAHEINNPLAIISLNAEVIDRMLRGNEFISADVLERVGVIKNTTDRASAIIKNLLLFSRENKNPLFEDVSLLSLTKNVLELCRLRLEENQISLQFNIKEDIEISCNSNLISQVLLNLLNNSIDAISVLPEKWIRIEYDKSADNFVNIIVTDSGPGIPHEIRSKLMQPFFTTKEVGKGTGLGLSISKGILESHGGTILLDENSPNTRFVFSLPLRR